MRQLKLLIAAMLIVLSAFPSPAQKLKPRPALTEAEWLIKRTIKDRSASFRLELIPKENGKDVFEVEATHGAVTVRYFQQAGAKKLELRYAGAGFTEQVVPPSRLFMDR